METGKKICVIGAGLSGLVALKELMAAGHDVVCYEQNRDIGGVFSGAGSSYDSLRLTVSNYTMAFSDAMPEEPMRFWTGTEYKHYLDRYAQRFGLLDHIAFGATVTRVTREGNVWKLQYRDDSGTHDAVFEHVALCSGLFQRPKVPDIPGLDTFTGRTFHSAEYQNLDEEVFKGKTVLCVGLGESSADITTEISKLARRTILSLRRHHMIAARFLPITSDKFCNTDAEMTGVTIDSAQTRAWHSLPALFKHALVMRFLQQGADQNPNDLRIQRFVEHVRNAGLEPESVVTKSELIFDALADGRLEQNVDGIEAITADSVIFQNGETVQIDIILLCTGYQFVAPVLDFEIADIKDLYKQMIHPDHGDSLALIGFVRPQQGGIPLMAELQSRYFALLCAGKRQLPPRHELLETARAEKAKYAAEFAETPYVTALVNGLRYNEGLAELIGCKPYRPSILEDPKAYTRYWHGHVWPVQYRMRGPGALPESEIAAYYRNWGEQLVVAPGSSRLRVEVLNGVGKLLYLVNKFVPSVDRRLLYRPI